MEIGAKGTIMENPLIVISIYLLGFLFLQFIASLIKVIRKAFEDEDSIKRQEVKLEKQQRQYDAGLRFSKPEMRRNPSVYDYLFVFVVIILVLIMVYG